MSRYTKTQITQLSANEQAAIDSINKNFQDIQEAIADTVSRSGNVPTHMTADFDLNGKRIINTSAPKTDNDFVRRVDVVGDIATVQSLVNATTNAAAQTLQAAQEVQEIIQDRNVGLVADDLALGDDSKIKQVAEDKDNIDLVASLDDDIEAVAALKDDIPVVVQAAEDIDKVEDIAEDITAVANNAANITAVADNEENINAVNANKTNINAVNANKTNIDAVAGDQTNIDTVAGIASAVSTVAGNTTDISNVATNMSDVNDCAANMTAIQAAPTAASSAAASAEQAAISAAGTHFKLFQHGWFDYQLDDMAWLRADTFSWQSGAVYVAAYNHLVDDYNNAGVEASASDTIGGITVWYRLCADGHKICPPDQESDVLAIYNATGVAWYYIIDTTNQRFKLPRTKYGFVGLRDAVGKYVSAGLPNITGGISDMSSNSNGSATFTGAFKKNSGTTGSGHGGNEYRQGVNNVSFNASWSNSIYGKSSTVQPPATQMYLYFYVGQFSQSATEQTAGLNAELFNGKADIGLGNIDNSNNTATNNLNSKGIRTVKETYKSGSNWYRIYSDGWVEQGGSFSSSDTEQNKTVNLLKTMSDSNYFISLQRIIDSYDATSTTSVVRAKGTSSFRCYGLKSSTCWEVKGFGA